MSKGKDYLFLFTLLLHHFNSDAGLRLLEYLAALIDFYAGRAYTLLI